LNGILTSTYLHEGINPPPLDYILTGKVTLTSSEKDSKLPPSLDIMSRAEMATKISVQETSFRDLAQRPCIETCCKDLAKLESSYRELVQRSSHEVSYIALAKRALVEILHIEILQRDLAKQSFT
jgi:hypothetical protein